MHWVDVYAEKLMSHGQNHVVESGTSISGQPHLGSAMDIIIADGICKAVEGLGGKSRSIWAMDDMDGLRKVPAQLPESFSEYIGQPAFKLPCPDGCCSSFVEHFTTPLLENLKRINVRPEAVSVAGMYADGKYDEVVRIALERASEIKEILKEVSGSEREDEWLPFFPICESCGKILTTQAYEFDGQKVHYKCLGGVAGKTEIPGCGHEGTVGIREGKLPWRVEWAARWSHLGVTCEPMGKDLMAAGGTFESSKVICERIYDSQAPEPVPYEWIVLGGGKRLGKSVGRILTLGEMVDIASPEITRYFFFRSQPTTHKEIDFELAIPKLAEDYEMVESVFREIETGVPEKEIDDIKRSYELAHLDGVPDMFAQVKFSHFISVIQTLPGWADSVDWDGVTNVLARTDNITELNEMDMKKGQAVLNWLKTHAPDNVKFTIQSEPPEVHLFPDEKKLLANLLNKFEPLDWRPEGIHDAIYAVAVEADIKAGPVFKLLYRIFLAKDRGPRLGYLFASLDKEFVTGRLRHFAE